MAVIPPTTPQPAVKSIVDTIKNNVQAQAAKQSTPVKIAPATATKTTTPVISGGTTKIINNTAIAGGQNGTYTLPDGSVHPSYGGTAPIAGATYKLNNGEIYKVDDKDINKTTVLQPKDGVPNPNNQKTGPISISPIEKVVTPVTNPKTGPIMTISPINKPVPVTVPSGNAGYKTLEGNIANALRGSGSLSANNVHIGSVQKDITNALSLGASKLTADETTALKSAQSFLNSASASGQNAMGRGLAIAQARTEMNKAAGMLGIKQAQPDTIALSTSQITPKPNQPFVMPQNAKPGFAAATGATQKTNLMVSSTSSSGKKITL